MKTLKITLVVLIVIFSLYSCGGGTSKQPANAEGFSKMEKELKKIIVCFFCIKLIFVFSHTAISLTESIWHSILY